MTAPDYVSYTDRLSQDIASRIYFADDVDRQGFLKRLNGDLAVLLREFSPDRPKWFSTRERQCLVGMLTALTQDEEPLSTTSISRDDDLFRTVLETAYRTGAISLHWARADAADKLVFLTILEKPGVTRMLSDSAAHDRFYPLRALQGIPLPEKVKFMLTADFQEPETDAEHAGAEQPR